VAYICVSGFCKEICNGEYFSDFILGGDMNEKQEIQIYHHKYSMKENLSFSSLKFWANWTTLIIYSINPFFLSSLKILKRGYDVPHQGSWLSRRFLIA
jgi:hypothetical protein